MKFHLTIIFGFLFWTQVAFPQGPDRIVKSAVPFLIITPDARASSMGNTGSAIANDASSVYWNASAMSLINYKSTFSLNYSPWSSKVQTDIYSVFASYINKLDQRNIIGFSIKYFTAGRQDYTDELGNVIAQVNPREFAIDAAYSKPMGENFFIGATLQFIYSGLYSAQGNGPDLSAGTGLATNISLTYLTKGDRNTIRGGLVIAALGNKFGYYGNGRNDFLPTNLRIGVSDSYKFSEATLFTIALEARKMLIPTPPVLDNNGEIVDGRDPDRSVASAIFSSFNDAPGGMKEELREVNKSLGFELLVASRLALRSGYNFEHVSKGGNTYLTSGFGVTFGKSQLDLSYSFAHANIRSTSNVVRFSLTHNLGDKMSKSYGRLN